MFSDKSWNQNNEDAMTLYLFQSKLFYNTQKHGQFLFCICYTLFLIMQLSQIPYPGGAKSLLPEAPAPPNNILFIQNLPNETTPMMLQMLFLQYPGFKEVRMVEAKPGIAFVEYGDEMQSTVAMQALQGFKIAPQNPMLITYAKK
jgi:hypothetical protein